MTTRDYVYKWSVYIAALLLLLLVETVLLARIPISGVCPMLFPLAVAAVGVFESPAAGAGYGLAAGFLHDAFSYENGSLLIAFSLALVGLFTGLVARRFLKRGFFTFFFCSLGGMGLVDGSRILFRLAGGERSIAAMLQVASLEIAYSFLFAVPVYLLMRAVYKKVGGSVLA